MGAKSSLMSARWDPTSYGNEHKIIAIGSVSQMYLIKCLLESIMQENCFNSANLPHDGSTKEK